MASATYRHPSGSERRSDAWPEPQSTGSGRGFPDLALLRPAPRATAPRLRPGPRVGPGAPILRDPGQMALPLGYERALVAGARRQGSGPGATCRDLPAAGCW